MKVKVEVSVLYTPAFGGNEPLLVIYDLGLSAEGDEAIALRDMLKLTATPTGAYEGKFIVTFESAK